MVVGDNLSFGHPREGEIWGELSGADVGRVLEVDRSVPSPGANEEEECQCFEQALIQCEQCGPLAPSASFSPVEDGLLTAFLQ